MTLLEYQTKLASYMSSDASLDVKEKAIKELRKKFDPTLSTQIAKQQIEESKADTSDIGEHDE